MHSNLNHGNNNSALEALPALSKGERVHSQSLSEMIRAEMAREGKISFEQFMRMALYDPKYGYYLAGQQKFGQAGDFVTAPEVSRLFSDCLAKQCAQVLNEIESGGVLEFGAGSGRMAADILSYLEGIDALPQTYWIVELSAELKQRQRETLQHSVPHLLGRVVWLDHLEGLRFKGVVLANEVLDAMPVSRFKVQNGTLLECFIKQNEQGFEFCFAQASESLAQKVALIEQSLKRPFADGYLSEVNLHIYPWLASLFEVIESGVLFCIDYGYPRHEYYLPERCTGTLMCHYKHRAHIDPLVYVGVQDITAYVDFTDVVESASDIGFTLEGFTTQAHFLSACGIDQLMQSSRTDNEHDLLKLSQEMKTLMLPGEMGERFKVLGLSRNYQNVLCGFSQIDYSNRL